MPTTNSAPGSSRGPGEAPFAAAGATTSWRIALLFVALTALAVISPFFFLGNASGHDIDFHVSSWMDVARQWHEGIIFPRWCAWANWGYGEPRFIFYPPISWMLGAALGSVLPWSIVPACVIVVALIVAGMSMWIFARDWLPPREAIGAAVIFAAGPYNLVMLYYRSDFAELLGAALFPLLFWGALRLARGETRCVPALAIAFAAVWLCNDPAGVMATYALTLALVVACVMRRDVRPLIFGVLAMAAGFALIAFYLFPAAYEQRWVQITGALTQSLQPSHNFLFAHNNELGFIQFNTRVSRVAVAMMAATFIGGLLFARRRHSVRALWWVLVASSVAAAFVMVPQSIFLWRLLPKLWFVQFPWRWMDALAVGMAIFVAGSAGSFRRRWVYWAVMLLALAGLATVATIIVQDAWWNDQDVPYLARGIDAGHGFDGMDEYAPLGSSHWDLPGEPPDDDKDAPPPAETPRVEELNDDGDIVPATDFTVSYATWTVEHRSFTVKANDDVSAVVRLLNYPAWDVRVDGKRVQPGYADTTGQMVLPIPEGEHSVDIRFRRTWDRTLGGVVSIIAGLALLASLVFARRDS